MASEARDGVATTDAVHGTSAKGGDTRTQLRVLPPAANWYCSQVCDWGYDARHARWLILYGAKNSICIYEFCLELPPAAPSVSKSADAFDQALRRPLRTNFVALLPRGKKDGRVTALRCAYNAEGELRVVCAGEEGAVQLWDPVSLQRVDQHRNHQSTEVTALGVRSNVDPDWVVAGDRQGVISLWQRSSAAVHTFSPLPRDAVFSLDITPFDKKLVAVGYRSGAVCIVNVVDKSVKYRLDGHELEVQSAVWGLTSTSTGSPVDYLATASRDRSIKVWAFPRNQTEEDSAQEPYLAARLEVRKPQQASSHSQSTRLWLPLAWTYDETDGCKYGLWTGSFEGNLQLFQWKGAPIGTVKPVVTVKNGHNRILFGIASLHSSYSTSASGDPTSQLRSLIATISLDRELRVWSEDLSAKTTDVLTCVERIPAQGGFTYSLDFNSSRKMLACGVGDQTIRIWNLGAKQSGGGYQTELVWKGMQSKVTCVRWHPLNDHVLAFGTEDGRVGLWDSRNKSIQRLKVKHSSEICQLEWSMQSQGELSTDSANTFQEAMMALEEAQAQGKTLEDAMAEQKERDKQSSRGDVAITLWSCDRSGLLCRTDVEKDTSDQIRKDCYAFAWDSSSLILSVGLSSGKVEIMTPSEESTTTKNHRRLSPLINIFEHKESVTAVSWSNADSLERLLLASGTKSGEILVYEGIRTASSNHRRYNQLPGYGEHVVAMFKSHSSAINCLRWNPTSEILASCGDDGTVRVWDVPERVLRNTFTLHANRVFSIGWVTTTILSSSGQDQSIRLWDFQNHASANPEESEAHAAEANVQSSPDPASLKTVEELATLPLKSASKPRGKKPAKSESILTSTFVDRIVRGDSCVNGASSGGNFRESICQGIAEERKLLEQDGKIDEAAHLYLMEGRIAEALRLLSSHGSLTAAWVSYAPMAGQDVWREVSLLYAAQLKNSGDYKSAALQCLAVGRVESAVQCYLDGGMYPEAISLIVSRLGSDHQLYESSLWRYAVTLEKKKKTDEAASVYLLIQSTEAKTRAITALGTSGDIDHAKRAMCAWEQWQEAPLTAPREAPINEDISAMIPSSVFVSVCGIALARCDFALAMRGIASLLHKANLQASQSPQIALYKLSLSVLGVASVLHGDIVQEWSMDQVSLDQNKKMSEANKFIQSLHPGVKDPWSHVFQTLRTSLPESASRPNDFWMRTLTVCRTNGLWFEGSDLVPDEVVEYLGDASAFEYMLSAVTCTEVESARLRTLIASSRLIIKIVAELMSGYLLSALEVLRDLLSLLTSSCDDELNLLKLLIPVGLLDPLSPPLFGELADEETDTTVLWAECCLLQCELVTRHLREVTRAFDSEDEARDQLAAYLTVLTKFQDLPDALTARVVDLLQVLSSLNTISDSDNSKNHNNGNVDQDLE